MQFKIGDRVVHPAYGVGHIVNIEEKRLSEEKGSQLCYKITLIPQHKVWVPVEMEQVIGLRLVTANSELDGYRHLIKSRPVPLPKNHYHRHWALIRRLKLGTFQVICEVVRDLTAWGWRKPLGPSDTATLHKTRENLYREWAIAAGVSNPEAIKEIDMLLQATHQAYLE